MPRRNGPAASIDQGQRRQARPASATRTAIVALCAAALVGCVAPGAAPTTTPASAAPMPSPVPSAALADPTSRPTAAPPPAMPGDAYTTLTIEGGPNVIATTEDAVWVELHRGDQLARIDPRSMDVTILPDVPAHCFVDAGPSGVWATKASDSRVTRVDPDTGKPTLDVTILDACGVSVTKDAVWVTSPGSGQIVRLQPETGEVELTVEVPEMPFVLSASDDTVWASGEGGGGWLAIIDATSGEILRSRTSPDVPFLDEVAFGFGSAWGVSRGSSGKLFQFDPETGDTIRELEIPGIVPSGVAVGEDAVWVTLLGGTLVRIDPTTGETSGAWQLPFTWLGSPRFAFGSLWMASLEENALIRLDPTAIPEP